VLRRRAWLGALVGLLAPFTVGLSTAAATDTLRGGQTLAAGQSLVSGDNHYVLTLRTDGDLVLYIANGLSLGRVLWTSGTAGDAGDHAVLQNNGNLVLYDANNQTLWSSNTSTAGCANLVVQEDGNLVLYNAKHAVWATSTVNTMLEPGDVLLPGERIFSYDEQYELLMQTDGNLVTYGATGPLWSTQAPATPGNFLAMHTSGDLVEENSAHHLLWKSATYVKGSYAHLQVDGNFVVYTAAKKAVWSSKTNAARPKGAPRYTRPAFEACPPPPPPPSPPPTPTPSPVVLVPKNTPFPKLHLKHLTIKMSWVWKRSRTRLHRVAISRFPHNATITFSCKGRGCPRHRHRDRAGWRQLNRLIRSLNGRYYRAGDQITIMITKKHFRPEKITVKIRWGRLPAVRQL
jgi:hypothetical protein